MSYRHFGDSLQGMSTKYRFRDTYRIQLREKDHPPPHVHLTGGGLDVMLSLETVEVMVGKAPPLIIKEALEWVRAHQVQLLEDWKRCYP
ncbi:hypothetical protein PS943_00417 [Pseudomonas fluorescens]|uniref:DUF4160 domain-containing protein n=2 Tax=Pseudomonas fluorescens group TaxID=136843 RepID=A0A5E7VY53_PSEFL|nr:hypothetical protein PS943_00417 [Pseudomonas fluorescens]